MHLNSPSEAFMFKEQEESSTSNVLVAAGVGFIAEICDEVDGLTSWITFFLKYLTNAQCTVCS